MSCEDLDGAIRCVFRNPFANMLPVQFRLIHLSVIDIESLFKSFTIPEDKITDHAICLVTGIFQYF